MAVEIEVRVRSEDKTLKHKFLSYAGEIVALRESLILHSMVKDVVSQFGGEPDDVVVKLTMVW